jgi:hypothetical protein
LRERLVPVERRIYKSVAALSREIAGENGDAAEFDRKLAVAMNTIAGLALVREFDPSGRGRGAEVWPYHRAALERMLDGG